MSTSRVVKKGRALSAAAESAGVVPQVPATQANIAQLLALMQSGAVQPKPVDAKSVDTAKLMPFDLTKFSKEQRELLADTMDRLGNIDAASLLRGEKVGEGLWHGAKKIGATNIKVRHVVYAGLIAGAVFFVWEGIAYKFDLPRFGFFG